MNAGSVRISVSVFIFAMLFVSMSCGVRPTVSDVQTDLGDIGNSRVKDIYQRYQNKAGHCPDFATLTDDSENRGTDQTPRVLISGFGPFSGSDLNFSGQLVRSILRCDESELSKDCSKLSADRLRRADDFGGRAEGFDGSIMGKSVRICTVEVDVQWDLAAAIIANEAIRFRPNLIIMTGLGATSGAVVEQGAMNVADLGLGGYNADGEYLGTANQPIDRRIVLEDDQSQVRNLTWNVGELVESSELQKLAKSAGSSSLKSLPARSDNDYICNNVSYVLAALADKSSVQLAGQEVILNSDQAINDAQIGFFHYPRSAGSGQELSEINHWRAFIAHTLAILLNIGPI